MGYKGRFGMRKIININDKRWDEYIEQSPYKDIYFNQNYLKIFETILDAKCNMFISGEEENHFLLPFFKRKIDVTLTGFNGGIDKEKFYDIISPWYYGGPLIYGDLSENQIGEALEEFYNFCKVENFVSGFFYFNPYLQNHKILNKFVEPENAGEVVFVSLKRDISDIFENSFSSSCRRAIKRGEKLGIKINLNNDDKYLKSFHEIYITSMDIKKAREFFKFSFDFFTELRDNFHDNFILITTEYKNRIVGGDIFLYMFGKMYYYLGAWDYNYPEVSASNRIFYEAIKFGKEKGLRILDLGGGHESLLRFKKSFSNTTKKKYVLKQIFNENIYNKLCREIGINEQNIMGIKSEFFPEYRKEV